MGSLLRFFADDSDQAFEVTAQQIFRMIQRNKDAGDTSDAASTYWSPNLGGDAVTMEVVLPPGAPPDGLQIAIPSLSHIFTNLKKTGIRKAGDAGSCEQDVACSAEYLPLSPSVASMDFVKADGVYICTGTLLNDRASDGIPFFLSAAHCIDNQTVASSLYTYWNWRKKTCGGSEYFQGNGTEDLLAGGATLLFTSAATDTTLLRLEDAPPPGAVFAASYSALPQSADVVSSVHHPRGDVQKYSVGTYQGTYREFGSTLMTAALSGASDANYIGTRWSTGVTEKGSSGGPLFLKLNGIPYVIGQLHGGASSCANPFGTDFYGRFDRAFANGMSTWLAPYSSQVKVPIYRFYNTKTRSHFYTIDQGERDLVITRYKEWSYEGVSFYAYGAQHTGTRPVYRFYSTQTGSHFFTMDEGEKQHIVANFPWWKFEGIAWYANTAAADGATSLYRFYNGKQGTHFFTASQTERDYIIGHYAEWSYEGVGYQVWMGP